MLRATKKLIPLPIRQRYWKYSEKQRERQYKKELFGDNASLVPPLERMQDGPASYEAFKSNGEEFLKIYKDLCGLGPDESMLDVGSGLGRKTLPLTSYFSQRARYEGLDIAKDDVEWCRSKITPRYGNFRFQWADVYNKSYNPEGKTHGVDYRFPFDDDSFTFVMLGSVFTHMVPADLEQYLSEIHRVLKNGGRCLISYFLLDDESLRLLAEGRTSQRFDHPFGNCRIADAATPEQAIAYPEAWIAALYEKIGLSVQRVAHGSWSGRAEHVSYQDLVLASKGPRKS